MKIRLLLLGGLLLSGMLAVAGRLIYLQFFERDFLQLQGDQIAIRTELIEAHRGFIFDRNHHVLAASTPVPSIWANPGLVNPDHPDLARLALLLDLSQKKLSAHLKRYRYREFIYLKRRVTPDIAEQINALGIEGIHSRTEYRRYYPAAEVAAHVLGLTNVDGFGQEGVELAFDEQLRGVTGQKRVIRDRRGRTVADLDYPVDSRAGEDLVLSIDLRIQYVAYRELQRAIERHQAVSGSIILLDARTGEVLALVNQPSYNPNMTSSIDFFQMRNRVLTDVFEPGSTIKPLIVATALDNTEYTLESLIETDPGFVKVGSKVIKDPVNYGTIDLRTLLIKSSQVGIVKLTQDLDEDLVFSSLTRFGLGQPTGLELPGEAAGRLPDPPHMGPLDKIAMAYGYGINVTSAQLARAYLAFVNQGFAGQITILSQEKNRERKQIYPIIKPSVADQILFTLESVVDSGGTASNARNALYRIAGKTGTVRYLSSSGYDQDNHIALFAGIAPVSNPRLVGVVVINQPQGELSSGGQVAAPIFSKVSFDAFRLMNVLPDRADAL